MKLLNHGKEIVLGKDGNAQLPGFLFLGASVFTDNHIGCLFGYRAGCLSANELDLLRGFHSGKH